MRYPSKLVLDLKEVIRSVNRTPPFGSWDPYHTQCCEFVERYSLMPKVPGDDSVHGVENRGLHGPKKALTFTRYQSEYVVHNCTGGKVVLWNACMQLADAMKLFDADDI